MEKILKYLDLTRDEYLVYKEVLLSPPTNLVEFARTLKMNRVTLYSVLSSLETKKLIHKTSNDLTKIKYNAVPAKHLLELVAKKKEEFDNEIIGFERQIEYLSSLSQNRIDRNDPEIQVIRGESTVDELERFMLEKGKPTSGFSYIYHVKACFSFDKNGRLQNNQYLQLLQKVTDKFVFPGNKENIAEVKQLMTEYPFLKDMWLPRWLPEEEFPFKINFYVFDQYVSFALGNFQEKDYLAYILKNGEIANSMRVLANFLWDKANPI